MSYVLAISLSKLTKGKQMKYIKVCVVTLISICLISCTQGAGVGLFEKKPETTPADVSVEQIENDEGKRTVISGTNDANSKDGMSARLKPDGEVEVMTGGSRKMERWNQNDLSTVRTWGWAFFVFGGLMLVLRGYGVITVPLSLGIGGVGIGLFNIAIAATILPILTGAIWNMLCVGLMIKFGVPGVWANLRDRIKHQVMTNNTPTS